MRIGIARDAVGKAGHAGMLGRGAARKAGAGQVERAPER